MNIFVGNLSFDATKADVSELFEGFGSVASVVIVMQKDGKKSRGFGFVEMLDDQQAQAAIAALAEKEFMGRPLNVEAARPKSEGGRDSRRRKKIRPKTKAEVQQYPLFHKTGGYKGGRRSRSFMMQRAAAGIEEQASPKRKNQENPMRWRKKRGQPKPWQKSQGESKPWKKAEGESRPWRKTEGQARPWKKAEGDSRSWKKARGESKPWRKSNERPQQSRFNPSTSLGMVRGNGERSRTKGRKKSSGYKMEK